MTIETGIVFDIQRGALHDGPGLRTTVFLKGCALRCAWCHNPESWSLKPESGESGKVYGKTMTVAEVMAPVMADGEFYMQSGGGLTLSGGEPTFQFAFCKALLRAARREGIHTCLDTCGYLASNKLEELMPLVDLFHYDLKLIDPCPHKEWTGKDNRLILKNLDRLRERKCDIILRCPIVPGVNDTPTHEAALNQYEESGDFLAVERLPYHPIGLSKFEDLGRVEPYSMRR